MLKITPKRRENLVKFCLNTYTTVLAGLIVPFALRTHAFHVSIFIAGATAAILLMVIAYWLER